MIDTTTPRGRAAAAALRLAERKPWREVTLAEIADEAGLTLADLAQVVASKADVLTTLARLVDEAVLRKAERGEPEESARERLFDVLMTRFDTMAPYRAGLARLAREPAIEPQLIGSLLTSQGWMLAAAGIPADGVAGTARTLGLASVYAATFRDWLADDDAGLARTMAALDRRLRRGEIWVDRLDNTAGTARSVVESLRGWRSRGSRSGDAAAGAPPGGAAPANDAPAPAAGSGPGTGEPTPGSSSSLH